MAGQKCRHGTFSGSDLRDLSPGAARKARDHEKKCRKKGTVFAHINWPGQADWVCCDGCRRGIG